MVDTVEKSKKGEKKKAAAGGQDGGPSKKQKAAENKAAKGESFPQDQRVVAVQIGLSQTMGHSGLPPARAPARLHLQPLPRQQPRRSRRPCA